ncbi:hypothetical protein JTF08_12175 [Micrococcaceae bacterium RIT802]|nr:hypothetical protein [Micrococcaceae bacterium RIT 802]
MTRQETTAHFRAVYGAFTMAVACGVVWIMAGTPDGAARNWLMVLWILVASVAVACGLNPRVVPRGVAIALVCATVAVPLVAWLAGVRDGLLLTPFWPVAWGILGLAFRGRAASRQEARSPSA